MPKVPTEFRVPITKHERRERQNLVFGWANVPHPVAKAAAEGSIEADLEDLRAAFDAAFPIEQDLGNWQWILATFPDSVIVERRLGGEATFQRVSYSRTDAGEFTFGQMVEVEQTFVEKALKAEAPFAVATPKVDLEGDSVPMPVLEEAAYQFVRTSGLQDVSHDEIPRGRVVESLIVTDEKLTALGVPEAALAKVAKGWWLGFEVDDDTMDRVESGELTMFSIGGDAFRIPVE